MLLFYFTDNIPGILDCNTIDWRNRHIQIELRVDGSLDIPAPRSPSVLVTLRLPWCQSWNLLCRSRLSPTVGRHCLLLFRLLQTRPDVCVNLNIVYTFIKKHINIYKRWIVTIGIGSCCWRFCWLLACGWTAVMVISLQGCKWYNLVCVIYKFI